eukprot:312930_1
MNWFSWLFILIPVMRIVNGQGKLLRMATKERLNQESMMILQQKQMMMMYKYQQLMQLKMPLEQLKRVNNFNKWNIANLQRENNEFKMQIVHLLLIKPSRTVDIYTCCRQQLKYETEKLKRKSAMKSGKKGPKRAKKRIK